MERIARHGTISGYRAHLKHGESACDECKAANNRYTKRHRHLRALGHPATTLTDATGTRRRIQALATLGWPENWVLRRAGLPRHPSVTRRNKRVNKRIADAITAVYEELCMTFPPQETADQRRAVARARNIARRNGWAPPLAWDDIDTDETPHGIAKDDAA